MQFILYSIQKYRNFLLFFVLELIALFFTIQFHTYRKSKFINSANEISGGIYSNFSSFRTYLNLKDENKLLNDENSRLKNFIAAKKLNNELLLVKGQPTNHVQKFAYTACKIINNDFHKKNNYITIDKGRKNGIKPDMGIVNSKGIVGITTNTSKNYASAISVLNVHFKTNARLKKSNYFGSLYWDGKSHQELQLKDIPRQASLQVGDTIVTGGRSAIFPEGILIGSVSSISYNNKRYEEINIKLFNDIRNITHAHIIKNLHKKEIQSLESKQHE